MAMPTAGAATATRGSYVSLNNPPQLERGEQPAEVSSSAGQDDKKTGCSSCARFGPRTVTVSSAVLGGVIGSLVPLSVIAGFEESGGIALGNLATGAICFVAALVTGAGFWLASPSVERVCKMVQCNKKIPEPDDHTVSEQEQPQYKVQGELEMEKLSIADELPASGSMAAGDELPASGSMAAGDELPASESMAAADELPASGSMAAADGLPVSGSIAPADGLPVSGSIAQADEIPVSGLSGMEPTS